MTAAPGTSLELITVGRICVDLYANEAGASFIDPQTFTKSIGGSATNVAIAAARLGHRAAVFTKVGDDPFGEYVRHKLDLFGVDTRFVFTHPSMPTPLAFAAMDPPEDPKLLMYRYPIGPDQTLQASEIDLQAAIDVPILWLTGAWFSKAPAREACWELLSARARKPHVVFDLDYRANFWPSPEAASADIGPVLDHVTVAVGQPRRVRGRRRVVRSAGGRAPIARARRRTGHRQDGRRWCDGGNGAGHHRRAAALRQGRLRPRCRRCLRWHARPRVCCRVGIRCGSSSTATWPARSWRRACCAPMRCPRWQRSRKRWRIAVSLDDKTFASLTETRVSAPHKIAEALAARRRRQTLTQDGMLFIVAADHTARGWSACTTTRWPWPTVARCSTVC